MKKIAFINQRYGLEVNGGSEQYTRQMAEHAKQFFEVEVLTTKAMDYVAWKNYYKKDIEQIEGIKIRRFNVDIQRDAESFAKLTNNIKFKTGRTQEEEKDWLYKQGPVSSGLIDYIKKNKDKYDVFIFVTYLYYPTVIGLPEVYEKSILIPTAHDEPFVRFDIYKVIFTKVRAMIYLTDEEKKLVNTIFENDYINNDVIALGIDRPTGIRPIAYIDKNRLDNYMLYVGRIDASKNCDILFRYFLRYKTENPNTNIKLVLIGKAVMEVPVHPDIIYLGFASDEEKYAAMLGAKMLVLPSEFESLSMSVLEAMSTSLPVLVNGKSDVLRVHCEKSNAGLYYDDYAEFCACTNFLDKQDDIRRQMRRNAKKYIETNYSWDVIMNKFINIVNDVIRG